MAEVEEHAPTPGQAGTRRQFLGSMGAAAGRAVAVPGEEQETVTFAPDLDASIDFRYAPLAWQSCICFTDYDSSKTLVGEQGELRYGHPESTEVVQLSLMGMEPDQLVRQWVESPGVPIVHTHLERPKAILELIAFATHRPEEGRVDNLILQVTPRSEVSLVAVPVLILYSKKEAALRDGDGSNLLTLGEGGKLFAASSRPFTSRYPDGKAWFFRLRSGEPAANAPLWCLVRFPQDGQGYARIRGGMRDPRGLLREAREQWRGWSPVAGNVAWKLPPRFQEFLVAGSCGIFQMREMKNGRPTIQAGPTVYRDFWVLDGHWIMEALRYLGFDSEAQGLLETEWANQDPGGGFFAGGGRQHWKDTGIAIFSLIRHAELAGDWTFCRRMQPNIRRAVRFLMSLREKARVEGSANGRYGLLARGFCDGGIDGVRSEFTNTLWVLAGLKALADATRSGRLNGFEEELQFFGELRAAFRTAARQEMRKHPAGFEYLPMLLGEDPQWREPEAWARPRPQAAQWALSQAIYPGLVFDPGDAIVRGHLALMESCMAEQVPAETGWIAHGGLWNNQAAFQAQLYLWLRNPELARLNFIGFLNHSSPVYTWREEQPLRGSTSARQQGDMPHISATSECIRYLRHMLALEADTELRLLAGIGDLELSPQAPYELVASPTRFGRLNLVLEPDQRGRAWRLKFERGSGPAPRLTEVPGRLGSRLEFQSVQGAEHRVEGSRILLNPEARSWSAVWRRS